MDISKADRNLKNFSSNFKVDIYLFLALATLLLNFVNQVAAFPFQCFLVLYGVFKGDVRYIPVIYLALQDAGYFEFVGAIAPIKINIGLVISVHNIFVIGTFFFVLINYIRKRFDKKSSVFFLFWFPTAIPALYMAIRARADNMMSVWQTPLILFMVPALYFYGVETGKTWAVGKEYFVKRMVVIFAVQMCLQLTFQYSVGCAFQDTIIPICFFFSLLALPKNLMFKLLGMAGAIVAFMVMFLTRYLVKVETEGSAGSMELVSTFSRLGITVIGMTIALFSGGILRASRLRVFPYVTLVCCTTIFAYATIRANTKIQGNVVKSSGAQTFAERFEFKLIGDRGAVWLDAIKTELFKSPFVFKRYSDIAVFHPEIGMWGEKMPPHNQVLTLICRSGWWMGLVMVLFLWWIHIREFNAATLIDTDRFTLCALLAPSAPILIIVGLTGQHVFTQMWHCSSMASLTFPGIIYGYVHQQITQRRGV